MARITAYLKVVLGHLGGLGGGFGLFFVAFCDSSFLSLPEINDVLIFYLCTKFKERAWYFVLMATLGSTCGCVALYSLGRFQGYGFLRRRYSAERLSKLTRTFERFGMFTVIAPALLPPPCPFKIFVLSAGVFGLSYGRFITAVLIGRGFRYTIEGVMAVRYGDRALDYFHAHYPKMALVALAVVVGVALVYLGLLIVRRPLRKGTLS